MLLGKIRVLRSHKRQYIPDLSAVELTPKFRGIPTLSSNITEQEALECKSFCPVGAIDYDGQLSLDLGRCIFCGECAESYPQAISFTNDWHLASAQRENLIVRPGDKKVEFGAESVRELIYKRFGRALKLRSVCTGGDGSCEMEMNASMNVNFDFSRYGVEFVASPRHADGIVITGPMTKAMDESLRICYDAIAEPKVIILAGSDAISASLFSGSDAIERSFLDDHKVDLYIPGNPVHPLNFIDGIMNLCGRAKR